MQPLVESKQYAESQYTTKIIITLISVILNLLFSWINNVLVPASPFFMDSIFTAFAAMMLGPFYGMITGLLTNIGMEFTCGMTGGFWPFAPCNMLTGIVVGLICKSKNLKTSLMLMYCILAITMTNALSGATVVNLFFSGYTDVALDLLVDAFTDTGLSLATASFWARIPTNLIDKMITIYGAYGLIYLLYLRKEESHSPEAM
ncbi:MAG: ECF transporter S component [Spirochaetales bacterium]|nr:ECF transporter S component [Spirochaetales bacterium]